MEIQPQSTAFATRELKDVLCKTSKTTGLTINDVQVSHAFLLRAHSVQQHRLSEHSDLSQWGSQLMRHAGNEIGSLGRDRPFAPQLQDSRSHEADRQGQEKQKQRN